MEREGVREEENRVEKKKGSMKRKKEKVSTSNVVTIPMFSHNSSQTKHRSTEFYLTLSPLC